MSLENTLKARVNKALSRFFLILVCTCFILPLYWMIISALKTPEELALFPPTLIAKKPQWVNFKEAVNFIPFFRYFLNTGFIAVMTCFGSLLSNFVIAYGFSRVKWPGRDVVFYTVLASIFIFLSFPVNTLTMVPLFKFFAGIGWVNSYLPLILPAFFGNPFFIFLIRQFLNQINFSISEAAHIDGASEFTIMRKVILPLAKPCLGVTAIMSLINAWNDFMGPLIYLHEESKYTLSIGLTQYSSAHDVEWNLLMAAASLVVIPEIFIFLFFQKYFVEGISMGSVKS
ncbi:MAG: carbohydrate ABC transporter permease [Spirochaetales bacterium]|nr:carbohydrate ABC transporter permease [Spirochaetales bacterium]